MCAEVAYAIDQLFKRILGSECAENVAGITRLPTAGVMHPSCM
jgi:hypothetical protein